MNILKCNVQYTVLEMVSYYVAQYALGSALASWVVEMTVYTIITWFNIYLTNIILISLFSC